MRGPTASAGVGYPSCPHNDAIAGASRSSASRINTPFMQSPLVLRQVALELPCAHLRDVIPPLLPFRRDEVRRDVFAERPDDHVVLLQLIERFVEIVRQVVYAEPPFFPEAHLPDVLVDRLTMIRFRLDAVHAGG